MIADELLHDDSGIIQIINNSHKGLSFDMEDLLNNLDLRQESIRLFGKTVLQPRLSRFYADEGVSYTYSQQLFTGTSWTEELHELKRKSEEIAQIEFNSALINYYRNGQDSMGLHADNETELGKNPVIASVNFGASRKMVFRKTGTKEKFEVILHHGDLLIMSGALQHNWKHEIPKQRTITEPRLNVTFRKVFR